MKGYKIRQRNVDDFNKLCSGLNAEEFSLFFGSKKYVFHGGVVWVVEWSGEWSASFGYEERVATFDGSPPMKAVKAAISAMKNAI